ncbi:MAG: tRNA lysidine(34) synthetase TilS [Pseudomonadota bacterium]
MTQAKWEPGEPIGLAVSGGSDSMALLHLARHAFPDTPLYCATVDHGLRPEATGEAAMVADVCSRLDVRHTILTIGDLDDGPNLQSRARTARYGALVTWAWDAAVDVIALGHTQDDVAETFLMRLARGSGLDGLASMPDVWVNDETKFIRPLLFQSRTDLRAYLMAQNVTWSDDPSNDDAKFSRVKARRMLPLLAGLGLTADRVAGAARHLRDAQDVIDAAVRDLFLSAVTHDGPDQLIDRKMLDAAPKEVRMRLVSRLAQWFGNAEYPPRYDALVAVISGTPANMAARTLHGIIWSGDAATLRMTRELAATQPSVGPNWDGRWWIDGLDPGQTIRALGADGLSFCPDWRDAGLPRSTVISAPSVWSDHSLVAAPHVNFGPKISMICNLPPWLERFSR